MLDPFSLYERKMDKKATKVIRYPVNPVICPETSKLP
jgi:hypothetical protein